MFATINPIGLTSPVNDTALIIQDDVDATKRFQFQASGITTGTQRTYTVPDANTVLAGLSVAQTFTQIQTISTNTTPSTRTPGGRPLQIIAANSALSGIEMEAYSSTPLIDSFTSEGTAASPAFPALGRQLGGFRSFGWTAANTWTFAGGIELDTLSAWTSSDYGTYLRFRTSKAGTNIGATESARVTANLLIGTTVDMTGAGGFSATGYCQIDPNVSTALPAVTTGATLRIAQADTVGSAIEGISYAATGLSIRGRQIGGTRASNTGTGAGAIINLLAYGHNGTAVTTSPSGRFTISALNAWSGTDTSTFASWVNTPGGSTTSAEMMRLTSNLLIGSATDIPGTGGLLVAGTTASTSSTTGALQVVGGVGIGGALNVSGTTIIGSDPGGSDLFRVNGNLTISSPILLSTKTTMTNFAGAGAGTLLNAPTAGNPTKWIAFNDNGTNRFIPCW